MRCRFNQITWLVTVLLTVLLSAQTLAGCLSLQIEKFQKGVEVSPPSDEFIQRKTLLEEILFRYGAPTDLVEMNHEFALLYQRAMHRGMKVSIGIPLKYVFLPNPSMDTLGTLLRYDTIVFIFTADGVLKDMKFEKGTERSLWDDYW